MSDTPFFSRIGNKQDGAYFCNLVIKGVTNPTWAGRFLWCYKHFLVFISLRWHVYVISLESQCYAVCTDLLSLYRWCLSIYVYLYDFDHGLDEGKKRVVKLLTLPIVILGQEQLALPRTDRGNHWWNGPRGIVCCSGKNNPSVGKASDRNSPLVRIPSIWGREISGDLWGTGTVSMVVVRCGVDWRYYKGCSLNLWLQSGQHSHSSTPDTLQLTIQTGNTSLKLATGPNPSSTPCQQSGWSGLTDPSLSYINPCAGKEIVWAKVIWF